MRLAFATAFINSIFLLLFGDWLSTEDDGGACAGEDCSRLLGLTLTGSGASGLPISLGYLQSTTMSMRVWIRSDAKDVVDWINGEDNLLGLSGAIIRACKYWIGATAMFQTRLWLLTFHPNRLRAASSDVKYVPSHRLAPPFAGSLISAANFPHCRRLTPRYLFHSVSGAGAESSFVAAALFPVTPELKLPVSENVNSGGRSSPK
nr:hypothetical protein GW17_00025521 [Ipomoea trifida]